MDILQWKIIQVIPETADTKTFILEAAAEDAVTWEAGQFLTFLFYHEMHEIRRSYSISAAPGIDRHIAITVKRKVNGEISRHILDHWRPGMTVTGLAPAGRFTLQTDPALKRHVYFMAAGSGIVPVFGLIKKLLFEEPYSHATLLYQNNNERNIIYDEPLRQLAALHPQRFTRIDLISNPVTPGLKPVRLNNWLLEQLLTTSYRPQTPNPLFYTCGPESFMRMVQFTLRVMGFSDDLLRKEHFVIDPPRKPVFSIDPAPRRVVLHFQKQRYEFTAAFPDTVLQAARHYGITMPFSCNTGRCATCVAKCRKGQVKMSNNEVLTDKDLKQGLVLTCVGYAETDIELEL